MKKLYTLAAVFLLANVCSVGTVHANNHANNRIISDGSGPIILCPPSHPNCSPDDPPLV